MFVCAIQFFRATILLSHDIEWYRDNSFVICYLRRKVEKRVCVYYFDIEFPAQFSYVVECANESLRMPNSVDSSSPEQMRGRQKQQQWEKSLDSIDFFLFSSSRLKMLYTKMWVFIPWRLCLLQIVFCMTVQKRPPICQLSHGKYL